MRRQKDRGQSLIEFSLVLPLLIVTVLGVVEISFLLLDQHIVTKLSREGANLISRSTTLGDAAVAVRTMASRPVDLPANSRMILSVVRNVPTIGAANYNKAILSQRHVYGNLSESSKIFTAGTPSFGPGPEYQASNQDSNTGLQVTNLPVTLSLGGSLYIMELYSAHPTITPLAGFGITVPDTLYSIAYF
jgi:Flp pilus assembly protein TadG